MLYMVRIYKEIILFDHSRKLFGNYNYDEEKFGRCYGGTSNE